MWTYFLLGGVALFWLGVVRRVRKGREDERYKLDPRSPVVENLPELTVVIPIRDEARNIGECLAALQRSDHPSLRIVVFDDGSTDGSADLARAAGVEVIDGGHAPLPAGWKGKPWALHRAEQQAGGEFLCFIDADVRVVPEALSRLHSYLLREKVDLVSGFGRLVMASFWEKVIQPSVGGLIIAGNDLAVVNDHANTEKAIANGQLILVRRTAYAQVGGHGAVKDDILDDIGLALAFRRAGRLARCLFVRELFSCRMYTGFSELWRGWTKNLYPGMRFSTKAVVGVVLLVLVEFLSPYFVALWALAMGDQRLALAAGAVILLIHLVRAYMDRLFQQDYRFGLLQPLGATMLVGLVLDSVRRTRAGTREWKGRIY